MDVDDTNYEVISEIMEQIFDGASFQSINTIVKDVEKTISSKKLKFEEIGYESGFNSRSAFYRMFKKHTGLSPSAYLKQLP